MPRTRVFQLTNDLFCQEENDFIIIFSKYYIFSVRKPLLKDSEIMSVLKLGFHKDITSIIIEKLKEITIIENIYVNEISNEINRKVNDEIIKIRREYERMIREEDERSIFYQYHSEDDFDANEFLYPEGYYTD